MGRRIRCFRLLLVIGLGAVVLRLVWVQELESSNYQKAAVAELTRTVAIPALRGGIYDRNGEVLALSVPTKDVVADDFQVQHPEAEATRLAPLLGLSAATLAQQLQQHSGYVVLARNLDGAAAQKVTAGNFPGITELDDSVRKVPNGSLALPVIGGMNASGKPTGGIEYADQHLLAGRSGSESLLESPTGVALPQGTTERRTKAVPGTGVELTLDEPLQLEAEQALGAEITASHADWGVAEIMDTRTGQILADASLSANADGTGASETSTNYAVSQTYEPGSAFKLVTFSAALQDGLINANSTFSVPDQISLDGSTFHDDDPHPTEEMSATQILAQSSNIGTSEIAQAVGEQRLLAQIRNLGFGAETALHFPDESAGLLKSAAQWEPTDYVDMPIGQDDGVTPQQLLDMENAVANGGELVQPQLVRARIGQDGQAQATAPSTSRRVMSTATAGTLLSMMQQVVAGGTGTLAEVPGYSVAGKTGTAEIPSTTGPGYVPGAYNATFVGSAPANHPVFSAVVLLSHPTPIYGGSVAAPVFSQIVRYALHQYAIPTSPGASTAEPTPGSGSSQNQDVT